MRNITAEFKQLLGSLMPPHIDVVSIPTRPLTKHTINRPLIIVTYTSGKTQWIRLGKFLKKYTAATAAEAQAIVENFKEARDDL
jgi:hypothetical protein